MDTLNNVEEVVGYEIATQELGLSESTNATNCTKWPCNNINAPAVPSDLITEFLRNMVNELLRVSDAPFDVTVFDLTSRPTQASLLELIAHRLMKEGCRPLGDANFLNMAILSQSQALAIAKEAGLAKIVFVRTLGKMLYQRWVRLDHVSDIDEAIQCGLQVMTLCSGDDLAEAAAASGYLKNLLLARFDKLGQLADINQAIEYQTLEIQLTPEDSPYMPGRLYSAMSSLCGRYRRVGNMEDLDRALEYQGLAIQLISDDDQRKPNFLINLGVLLRFRHERNGSLAELNQAIECLELALNRAQSEDHPERPNCLMYLGSSLSYRYQQTGDLSDLNKGVEYCMMAVRLAPAAHPDRSRVLDDLGCLLVNRYERLRSPQDLEQAIQYHELAVHLAPNIESLKPLNNLAIALQHRFERFDDPADLDRTIEYQLQAIQLSSNDQTNKADAMCNLGNSLYYRHRRFRNVADIDLAIEHMSLAVTLIPEDHSHKPSLLAGLGGFLITRFMGNHSQADIDLAIDYLVRAVELIPDGHARSPRVSMKLGGAYLVRFRSTCSLPDLVSAVTSFRKAANPPILDPRYQIRCAQGWADYSLELNLSPLEAYQAVFTLLPHFVWLGQTVQARYHSIPSISHLVSAAVAWSVSVGTYDTALEWLEQGRSVVWTQLLQTRTPFDDLAAVDPQLADRMRYIASQLEAAEPGSQTSWSPVGPPLDLDLQGQRHGAALQWEQLLQEVRQLPGFEGYMLPRKAHLLKKAATRGPVVVINTHETRCDALIIVPDCDEVIHVPLIRLAPATLCKLRADLVSLIGHRGDEDKPRGFKRNRSSESAQDTLYPLKVLWSDVVEPILSALQYTNKPLQDKPPHITWCVTGALSFLPLHAAGLYDGTSRNAFDLVVSSYTPTLAALLATNSSVSMSHAGVLAVGQYDTTGLSLLPKTVDELAIIKKYTAATGYSQLDGPTATVDATLDAMEQYSWVHLACHAIQDRSDPRQSAFYLHGGRLTLETITKRTFRHKGLAFLSACQTATGDDFLPDEAMHLAAGMLAAGYPSVIATMWSIADEDGPEMAEVVYGELVKDGKMDCAEAAMALHKAASKLRNKVGVEGIRRWAPFIHIGL